MLPKVEQTILRAVDPHLGHGYLSRDDLKLEPDEELTGGCVRLGCDEHAIRIGILGGSTSDVSLAGSWLRPFRAACLARSRNVTLYSGAVSGYSSSQELIKLIRDVLPIQPTVVIALSGLNDLGFVQAAGSEYPMVHWYQQLLMGHLARKPEPQKFFGSPPVRGVAALNDKYRLEGMVLGARNHLSAARVWERNHIMAHALCRELGVAYRCFLQPTVGVGDYVLSRDEVESFEAYVTARKQRGADYPDQLHSFYEEARKIVCDHSDFMVDLVDLFRGGANLYADVRHPNAAGNARLAEAILGYCESWF